MRNARIEIEDAIGHDGSLLGKIVAFRNAMFLRRIKTSVDAGFSQVGPRILNISTENRFQDSSYQWITKASMNKMYWVEIQLLYEYFSCIEDVRPYLKSDVDFVSFTVISAHASYLLSEFSAR